MRNVLIRLQASGPRPSFPSPERGRLACTLSHTGEPAARTPIALLPKSPVPQGAT